MQPVNRYPLHSSPGIIDRWVLTGCRFLGTSSKVLRQLADHLFYSYLILSTGLFPHPFNTFRSPGKHRGAVCPASGGIQHLRGAFPHLIYSIDRILPKFGDAIIQRTPLMLTARQLREFARPTERSANSYCTPTIRPFGQALPGVFHRLRVPVASPSAGGSRWAAGYGAVFAK
jgi:hypothetical protein